MTEHLCTALSGQWGRKSCINGRLSCGSARLVALGIFGALTKLKSAANDLPYTIQVALGLCGQCNAQASKVAHSRWFSLVLDQRIGLLLCHSCVQCCERCSSLEVLSWYLPCCTPPWVLLSPVSVFVSSFHTFLFLSFFSPALSHDTHSADPVKVKVALGM